jgi:hypothetical protein
MQEHEGLLTRPGRSWALGLLVSPLPGNMVSMIAVGGRCQTSLWIAWKANGRNPTVLHYNMIPLEARHSYRTK